MNAPSRGSMWLVGFSAVAVMAVVMAAVNPLNAKPVSDAVKVACSSDYKRFCKSYKIGTSKLRQCMRANGRKLSRVCVDALVEAGEVKRSEVAKYRK